MVIYEGKSTTSDYLMSSKGKHLLYLFEIRLYSLHTGERRRGSLVQDGGI